MKSKDAVGRGRTNRGVLALRRQRGNQATRQPGPRPGPRTPRLGRLYALCASVVLLLAGCANGDKGLGARDALAILQEGGARGHLTFSMGGSPLSAGMKQVFFLGPENTVVSFDGDVDFGHKPATQPAAGSTP